MGSQGSDATEQLSQREKFIFITYEHIFVDFLLCDRYWARCKNKETDDEIRHRDDEDERRAYTKSSGKTKPVYQWECW